MTSSLPHRLAIVVAALALAACHRGVTVSSPAPAPSGAGTATMAKTTNGLPADVTPAMIEEGRTLFAGSACARCHGAGGVGGQNGPNLTDTIWVQTDGSYDA